MRSVALHSARVYDRSYVLAIFAVAYVAIAAIQERGPRPLAVAALVLGPLVLAAAWRRTRRVEHLSASVDPRALVALRGCAWGATLWVAARAGPPGRAGFELAGSLALGAAVVAAQVALARVPGRSGLARPPRSAFSLDAAAFCALVWIAAAAPPASRAFAGGAWWAAPEAGAYARHAACIASLLVALAAALRQRATRHLELGVLDRASGAVAAVASALALSLPAALLGLAAPEDALPLAALGSALACAWAATAREATAITRLLRGALVVMALGAPIAFAAAAFAQRVPEHAGTSALTGAALALCVGVLARAVARPLTAEQTRWLEAIDAAGRAAREPDPEVALVAALRALQGIESTLSVRPELWRADPPEVLRVDAAGYLHTERAAAPPRVHELALAEPERLLRRDVLAALEVRRPEVRPLLAWLDARDGFLAALIGDDDVPLAMLVLPRGSRRSPLTLEEALATRRLCDRMSSVLSLSSSIARSRSRELSARERADELVLEAAKLEAIIELSARPRDDLLHVLAARARVAAYSARARAALDRLSRLAGAGGDVALELPVGVDALELAALVHLGGPRRGGPFIVLEGTAASAHEPALYAGSGDSHVARARGGTLLLLNVAALPLAAQDALALALSERTAAASPAASFGLIATLPCPAAGLLGGHQLSRTLAPFLLGASVQLPTLAERPEDLRGLVLDRLCRAGVRFAGASLGIDPRALALLIDHPWPGNMRELEDVIERAARLATGERVSVADLQAAGFRGSEPDAAAPSRSGPLRVQQPETRSLLLADAVGSPAPKGHRASGTRAAVRPRRGNAPSSSPASDEPAAASTDRARPTGGEPGHETRRPTRRRRR